MTVGDLALESLVGAGTVIVAIVAARAAHSLGLPALLVFLGLGLALGEAGAGIQFSDPGHAEVIGLGALALILAEGGLTTNWGRARPAVGAALALATVGVVVSIAVTAGCAHWLLGFSWRPALLLGAVLAPTDAAAVFSVLRRLPLPPLLSGILEGESGLNDPPTVLAVTLLSSAGGHHPVAWVIIGQVAWELIGGLAIGLAVGFIGAFLVRRAALPASGLYPVAVIALVVVGYGAASLVAASGFLAVYVSAVVLGNARLPHGPATRGFAEGVGWLAQIGLFVMLGLLVSPDRLPSAIAPALAVGVIVVFLARPAAVVAALAPLRAWSRWRLPKSWHLVPQPLDRPHWRLRARRIVPVRAASVQAAHASSALQASRASPTARKAQASTMSPASPPAPPRTSGAAVSWRVQAFLSWAGLRGAVPIVLATIPLSARVPGATRLFDTVFIVVVAFTMLQGPTLPWVARLLGVVAPAEPLQIEVEAAPLEELHADLLQASVPPGSLLHGVEVYELRLPRTVNLSLVVRDGEGLVPGPTTVLRTGDRLLIVCPAAVRRQVERRLRAVSRAGKLAGWYGEHGR
ncbi:MAG TPA: potassium/proton antiporter [Trebonia sp.]|jgi:cell volume regulation protein A|nr:potassium/proton antiporter [Trebonia sp.]